MRLHLQRIGPVGLLLTAISSPCCFPLFGVVLTALGLGSFELFGPWSMTIFMALTIISLAGLFISYRMHRCMYPLLIAIPSAFLIIYSYYFIDAEYWINFLYTGMFGMAVSSVVDYYRTRSHRKAGKLELGSVLTCPVCMYRCKEYMPTDACVYFYECKNCQARLKPQTGDCCVFCSYGSVKCPPAQMGEYCCK